MRIPTLAETLRIKAVLILQRNATRDYLDFVALAESLGQKKTAKALASFDKLYPQPNKSSPLQQLQIQLASAQPFDLEDTPLNEYKKTVPHWATWDAVKTACNRIAIALMHERI